MTIGRVGRRCAAATLVAVAGCATAARGTVAQARLDEPFRLEKGQTASVAGTRLVVGFTGVESDSRCPVDVQCIRAGEARVQVTLRTAGPGTEAPVLLATEGAEPRSTSLDGFDVHLVALDP
ncbi:MAG TPA: hypothetical protein VEX86_05920, partial [Longimicrobium sp.]|nr:hypothetical protein [Longimicrobium sp.]